MSEEIKGILYMLISTTFFSIGGVFIKLVSWAPNSINCGRCMIAVFVFGGYLFLTKHRFKLTLPSFLGALAIAGTTVFYNMATKYTTAGNAVVLEYTSPIFIIILMYLLFKKKPRKEDIIAAFAVMLGIFWFFLDGFSTGHHLGNALGICSAISISFVYVIKLNPREDLATSIFFGLLLGSLIGIPSLVTETNFDPVTLLYVLILGVFQLGLAYVFFFLGLTRCQPIPAVLAGALEPILNPFWVMIFYGETISLIALPGMVIVCLTVIIYNLYGAKKELRGE